MKPFEPKARPCKQCGQLFTPRTTLHNICSPKCVFQDMRKEKAQAKVAAKAERAETRRRKQALETRGEVLAQAKLAVQAFRRHEELAKGRGCMSCGRSREEVESGEWRPGGYWDGGHFKSKGAHPELALEPKNIWLQCKSCNAGSGKYARKGYTVNASFEANLIAAEGQELVDLLNGPHEPKHYDIDQLRAIRDEFRTKLKELKK